MELMPDPRLVIEEQADGEKEARQLELRAKKLEEEQMMKQAEKIARQAEREKQKQALLENRANRIEDEDDED